MDLLIDIGNTRLKWALHEAGRLHDGGEAAHRTDPAGAVARLFDGIDAAPARVHAANVAGERLGGLVTQAVRDRWGRTVLFAATRRQGCGIRNGYSDYRRLGVDRWLAMIAAADGCNGPMCVVDAGTAVTIDPVAADGAHLGGYIVPGLALMWQVLGAETGDLRRLAGDEPFPLPAGNPAPGRDTAAAIGAGPVAALCALIERCVDTLRDDAAEPVLIMTGGDAEQLIRHVGGSVQHRPQLVLEGLARYDFDRSAD